MYGGDITQGWVTIRNSKPGRDLGSPALDARVVFVCHYFCTSQ